MFRADCRAALGSVEHERSAIVSWPQRCWLVGVRGHAAALHGVAADAPARAITRIAARRPTRFRPCPPAGHLAAASAFGNHRLYSSALSERGGTPGGTQ